MKKLKLVLNESLVTNINTNQVDLIEDVSVQQKPDYQIIDITVIPDEEYNPTIQSILIDLDESNRLCESAEESKKLSINILSETVNVKTGYSNSLFEFENANHTITLSLVLQETERSGIYKVEAYTTKGEKVFESNTCKPRKLIESYLNSLAVEYLIDKPLKETNYLKKYPYEKLQKMSDKELYKAWLEVKDAPDEEKVYDRSGTAVEYNPTLASDALWDIEGELCSRGFMDEDNNKTEKWSELTEAEDPMVDTVKEDLDIEPGSDEESQVDSFNLRDLDEWIESLYEEGLNVDEIFNHLTVMNSVPEDYGITEDELRNKIDSVVGDAQEGFSVEDFVKATKLVDEIKNLNIDYSKWNDASQEERIKLVTPELNRFYNKYKVDFEKNPDLFSLVLYNLDDDNFHTEANVLRKLNGEEI